jgi:hypothetical protein
MDATSILIYVSIFSFFSIFFALVKQISKYIEYLNRKLLYSGYSVWYDEFDKCKNLAYQKIYREQILSYNLSNVTIVDKDISKLEKEYINMVYTFCGPRLFKDVVSFYGDIKNVFLVLSSEFVVKIFQDEQELMKSNNMKE